MDSFEAVIAAILQRKGYWTQLGFKVELTKAEKREIGRHSAPRWELDVVGYSGARNEIMVIECKSFLDSAGVRCDAFDGSNPQAEKRYKLFCEETLRKVVFCRLCQQLSASGFCPPNATIRLCLAAGKIYGDEAWLERHFGDRGWDLWTPTFIRHELRALRDTPYDNNVATVVTKILLRDITETPR